jgi:hypothetical protein
MMDYRPLAAEVRAALEGQLAPEAIRAAGHSATVGDEYLPREADPRIWRTRRRAKGPVVAATGPVELTLLRDRGTHCLLHVESERPVRLELARWAFPGWRARLEGRPVPLAPGPFGSIELAIPAGSSRLELDYRSPLVRRVTVAISAVAIAVWLVLFWRWKDARIRQR